MFAKRHLIYTFTLLATALVMLSACETVDGAGRDIEHAGESIQGSSH